MRGYRFAVVMLITSLAGASAQPVTGEHVLTPPLGPSVTQDGPSEYLRAAEGALARGRVGEVREALEMAQTRLLDRSVPLGQTDVPSRSPAVEKISQALQALAARDRMACMQAIENALQITTDH